MENPRTLHLSCIRRPGSYSFPRIWSTITGGSTKSSRIERLIDNSPLHAISARQYSHDWKTNSSTLHPRSTAARARSFVAMADIELGTHTIRPHGRAVAKIHMHDWIILILLIILIIILNVIEPFHLFVGRDMMEDLRYPLKSNRVPVWAVPGNNPTLGRRRGGEHFFLSYFL
ncbi:Lipid phosphate phosphatase 2 [Platanthera guangdongensis]|uniref:Lipid phosphate phosphatase 2 n=1 Tax=Platanthera guangdongensis TaxID=2320717 RepID=A0ABR2MFX8_9ASPA